MTLNKSNLKWIIGGSVIAGLFVVFVVVYLVPIAPKPYTNIVSQSSDALPSATPAGTDERMCKGRHDEPIAYKRLSDETSIPFVKDGKPVPADNPHYDEYQSAIASFPDVRSCLQNSEKDKEVPNLTLFDWATFNGTYDAEVCLFRIFSSIGSVDGAEQWFESQGFTLGLTQTIPVILMDNYMGEPPVAPGTGVGAAWFIVKCGARFSHEVLKKGAHSFSVIVVFTASLDVSLVGTTYNFL